MGFMEMAMWAAGVWFVFMLGGVSEKIRPKKFRVWVNGRYFYTDEMPKRRDRPYPEEYSWPSRWLRTSRDNVEWLPDRNTGDAGDGDEEDMTEDERKRYTENWMQQWVSGYPSR